MKMMANRVGTMFLMKVKRNHILKIASRISGFRSQLAGSRHNPIDDELNSVCNLSCDIFPKPKTQHPTPKLI